MVCHVEERNSVLIGAALYIACRETQSSLTLNDIAKALEHQNEEHLQRFAEL